jgi:hypothetical protein
MQTEGKFAATFLFARSRAAIPVVAELRSFGEPGACRSQALQRNIQPG